VSTPPPRRIRASSIVKVVYGFGDASKGGFGWSIDFGNGIRVEFGEWCEGIQGESSNYQEFRNLVNALLRAAEEGQLKGAYFFYLQIIKQPNAPIKVVLHQVGWCLT
jgi:hypothetical protein